MFQGQEPQGRPVRWQAAASGSESPVRALTQQAPQRGSDPAPAHWQWRAAPAKRRRELTVAGNLNNVHNDRHCQWHASARPLAPAGCVRSRQRRRASLSVGPGVHDSDHASLSGPLRVSGGPPRPGITSTCRCHWAPGCPGADSELRIITGPGCQWGLGSSWPGFSSTLDTEQLASPPARGVGDSTTVTVRSWLYSKGLPVCPILRSSYVLDVALLRGPERGYGPSDLAQPQPGT